MNIFEKASRSKLLFSTERGFIRTDDLWDLPLTSHRTISLDAIGRDLLRLQREVEIPSLVSDASKEQSELNLKLDIVKHVIAVKQEEAQLASQAAVRKEKKQQILAIIAEKEMQAISSQSLEDLKKLADSL
jgi:hypothetical protein